MSLATTPDNTPDDGLAVVLPDTRHPRQICSVDGCPNLADTRGLCRSRHWKPLPKLDAAGRARMQDVKFLLDPYRGAESPQMICVRLNVTAHALARWLERHGERELAHVFYGLDKRDKRSRQRLAA